MACIDIREVLLHTSSTMAAGQVKTDEAVASSTAKLQAVLEAIAAELEEDLPAKGATPNSAVIDTVLARLGPVLSGYLESDPAKAVAVVDSLKTVLTDYANTSPSACAKVTDTFAPVIRQFVATHPGQEAQVLALIAPIVQGPGQQVSDKLQEAMHSFAQFHRTVGDTPASAVSAVLAQVLGKYQQTGGTTPPNYNEIEADLMMFITNFQVQVSQSQANQDKIQIALGLTEVNSANAQQINVDNQITQLENEEAEANSIPSWCRWLIGGLMAAIGAIVAGITAGLAAGLVAVAIGAFMASPLFQMTTSAIASKIAADLEPGYYQDYINEGYPPAEAQEYAQEKADSVANIIAKVAVIIGLTVTTAGLGGVTVTTDTVATGAAEGTVDGAADAAENLSYAIEDTTTVRTVGWSTVNSPFKQAALTAIGALAGSNVAFDALSVDPVWAAKNQWLVAGIDAAVIVVSMVAGYFVGKSMISASTTTTFATEQLLAKASVIIAIDEIMQVGNGALGVVSGVVGAYYLNLAQGVAADIASAQQQLSMTQNNALTTQEVMKQVDSASNNITQEGSAAMNVLGEAAGLVWASTDKALRS